MYINRSHVHRYRIRRHIHSFFCPRNIRFHYRITLMNKIFLCECILIGIRIRIYNKILIAGSCIGRCPEEILSLFGRSEFRRKPDITIEFTTYFSRYIIIVLMLQLSYLTIHLGARKEIDNLLLILFYKFLKFLFIRCLYGKNQLRGRINILSIFKSRFCINIAYVHDDDITYQLQSRIVIFRRSIHNPKRTFRLRQTRHIRVEHIIQSPSCRTLPQSMINNYKNLIRTTAGGRGKYTLLTITRRKNQCYKSHTEEKQILLHIDHFLCFYKTTTSSYIFIR